MQTLFTHLGLFALLAVVAVPDVAASEGRDGRYQGVEASETAVWIVDTRTGRVRKCTQEFADAPPRCTQSSD